MLKRRRNSAGERAPPSRRRAPAPRACAARAAATPPGPQVIQVPTEAVGFVTGAQGNFLRQVEEEWGTLMFFADFRGREHGRQVHRRRAAA